MRRKIALVSATAAALVLALASLAQAAIVSDPDETAYAQGDDVEWASSSWWGPPGRVLITHTIKTYGTYAYTPCVVLTTDRGRRFSACGELMDETGARNRFAIGVTRTHDTVAYSFTSGQIGNPRWYRWRADARGPNGDQTATTRLDLPQLPFIDDSDPVAPLGRIELP